MALRAPAAERNKEFIFKELDRLIGASSFRILEIASGTGQHIDYFARRLTNCHWTPTDIDLSNIKSINKYVDGLKNVENALVVDVSLPVDEWPCGFASQLFDVILCVNLLHISPWKCAEGLFRCASKLLSTPHGVLVTYGPYAENGALEPESNVRFDQQLRMQNPEWGVRDIRDLRHLAVQNGLQLAEKVSLPANNKLLVFRRLIEKS